MALVFLARLAWTVGLGAVGRLVCVERVFNTQPVLGCCQLLLELAMISCRFGETGRRALAGMVESSVNLDTGEVEHKMPFPVDAPVPESVTSCFVLFCLLCFVLFSQDENKNHEPGWDSGCL